MLLDIALVTLNPMKSETHSMTQLDEHFVSLNVYVNKSKRK